jgi:hypothetical protein
VHFNRINGFYVGNWFCQELKTMAIDKRNEEINKALESRFAQLNSAIEAYEQKLKRMMVPKDTSIVYDSYQDTDPATGQPWGEHSSHVGMIKLRGAWRLCYADHHLSYQQEEPELDWKPLVEGSIEIRIEAAKHIEKLMQEIVNAKEKLIPEIEQAIASLAQLLR